MGWLGGSGKTSVPGAMYQVDARDRVVELEGFPQFLRLASVPDRSLRRVRHCLRLFYVEEAEPTGWDYCEGHWPGSSDETIAIVRFDGCSACLFGPPNDSKLLVIHLLTGGYGRIQRSLWKGHMGKRP